VSWRNMQISPNGRDRFLVMGSLSALIALSWLYLARMNAPSRGIGIICSAMPAMLGTPFEQFVGAAFMWMVMMVAMMLPTAVPAIHTFDNFARKRAAVVGSAPGQVALSRAALLTPALQSTSIILSAAILLLAGAFQFASFKDACLTQCRSPFAFFLATWRDGNSGAFVLGIQHGSYCVGCCWALMGLMFVGGAMNLLWMAVLSLLMLGEKVAPASWHFNRGAGVVLIAWDMFVATQLLR
jgi:predicted metal-binding membrane protein